MTAVLKSSQAGNISLAELAHRMVDESKGDMSAAATKLFNYTRAFPRMVDEMGMIAARTLISNVPQIERRAMVDVAVGRALGVKKEAWRENDAARAAREASWPAGHA